tara:strand:- start:1301 stop:2239 length:939 start_codon:yes stop_codon:yes gene_type:complete
MAYIGVEPNPGRNREVDDISSGFNGSTTAFTLQVSSENISPGDANSIIVSLGGVIQNPNTDYTVAASTITFTTAPASGLSFFAVVQGQGTDTQINTPSDGSVSTAKLVDDAVTAAKLAKPIDLADNEKIRFGTGNDLEIFHNGSNSFIDDAGQGSLFVESGGTGIYFQKLSTSSRLADFNVDGAVNLYFNASNKLSTAAGGISLTGGAAANITALSDGATITIDMATACHHSVTLGGNRTFAAPSNQVVGQSGSIFITQDGTGSRTAAFNSAFKFVGGSAPTLTTGAGLTDRIDYIIKSSNVIHCAVSLDVK